LKSVYNNIFITTVIGLTFFVCRQLNIYINILSVLSDLTNIVYFPAGIRLLAVLIFNWLGVAGILLG
jgi:hypothetical protein